MDLSLDRSAQGHQQEPQVGRHMDQLGSDRDVSVHPAAFEVQGVALPSIRHIEFFRDMVGHALDFLLRFGHRAGMRAFDFDAGHDSWSTADWHRMRPILRGFRVCTKNRCQAVC